MRLALYRNRHLVFLLLWLVSSKFPLSAVTNSDLPLPGAQNTSNEQTSTLYFDAQEYFRGRSATELPLKSLPSDVWHDAKATASSPKRFQKTDLRWMLPLGAAAGLLIGTDHHVMTLVHSNAATVKNSDLLSNGGVAALSGAALAVYGLGKYTRNEHLGETGRLSIEALADSFIATEALKIATSRQRPTLNSARGYFADASPFNSSFPSQHAALAWAAATVFAQEYPGPLTRWSAYGLASVVSVARVTGYHHFPSDVLIGAATGYLIGRFVYRRGHDDRMTDRTGATPVFRPQLSGPLSSNAIVPAKRRRDASGSPYVPLDSWIYPALKRLAALGYIPDQVSDLAPWTRLECLREVRQAEDYAGTRDSHVGRMRTNTEALRLLADLREEFDRDEVSDNVIRLESLYTRTTGILGRPLRDSYHFGQTVANDFGRPYEQGLNNVTGFSSYATSGPFFAYVRGEYQYAGGRSADPLSVRDFVAKADANPTQNASLIARTSQFQTQEMYAGVKFGFENITFGKQNLWWGPGEESAFSFSSNAQPFYSLRLAQAQPIILPGVLSHLGKIRTDFLFGKLSGHSWPPRPYLNAQKISLAITDNFEVGFTRSAFFGGVGHPLTLGNFASSLLSTVSTGAGGFGARNDPGDRHSGFDFRYRVPGLRRYLSIYSDSYADDDPLPLANPRRSAWGPGLYLAQIPHLRKLDFRFETYSTLLYAKDFGGNFIYWNSDYRDAYTNRQYLLGSWVGRDSRAYSASSTFWFSARSTLKASFRQLKAGTEYLPGGGTQTDAALTSQISLGSQWIIVSKANYERYYIPILGSAQRNLLLSFQVIFYPHR